MSFEKKGSNSFHLCMPPWNFQEMSKCRQIVLRTVSESVVSELFDKLGGIPRSVLHIPSKNAEQALQDDLDVIINAFSNVTDLFQIYKSMLDGTETTLFSSNLLHIVPSPDNYSISTAHRQWASRYVLAKVSKDRGLNFWDTSRARWPRAMHLTPRVFTLNAWWWACFRAEVPLNYQLTSINEKEKKLGN